MKIIVDQLATNYSDTGSGEVLLFLHGWQDNLQTFDTLVTYLPKTLRIVKLDLPGFGETETPATAWALDDYVSFVAAFCAKLEIQPDILIGHSFGGRITIKGISSGVLKAKKIVLIGSAGIAQRTTVRNFVLYLVSKIFGFLFSIPPFSFWKVPLRKKFYKKIGSDYLDTGSLKEIYMKVIAENLVENAQKLSLPTLLIWGRNDTQTPLSDGQRFESLILGSVLKVIDDAGHFVHREKPTEVAKLIQEFIC
jgi:pimeloyl-ACP methyl ester carboxylesterase